jgi:hypothetical protein
MGVKPVEVSKRLWFWETVGKLAVSFLERIWRVVSEDV